MAAINPYEALNKPGISHGDGEIESLETLDRLAIRAITPVLKTFEDYVSSIIAEKDDPDKDVWEQGGSFRSVRFRRPEDMRNFFVHYDACRESGVVMHWTQKQDRELSGLRLDYDLLQTVDTQILTMPICRNLVRFVIRQYADCVQIPPEGITTTVVVSIRPRITRVESDTDSKDEKTVKYKNGIHLDAPGLMMHRDLKRLLIKRILDRKVTTSALRDVRDLHNKECLDANSGHVPLVLVGSCKRNATPYIMKWAFTVRIDDSGVDLDLDEHFLSAKNINHSLELNVNWRDEKSVIHQHNYRVRVELATELTVMSRSTVDARTDEQMVQDTIHTQTVADADCAYMKTILELLKPVRYDDRREWFKVVYALVNSNEKYMGLARWWSRKSTKFDEPGFLKCVDEVRAAAGRYSWNERSIYTWAYVDSPEQFRIVQNQSCVHILLKFVLDENFAGMLGDKHFAVVIKQCLEGKYATELQGKTREWYEFKLPGDRMEPGQIYKWVKVTTPDSIYRYIWDRLPDICTRVKTFLDDKIKKMTNEGTIKLYILFRKNFTKSIIKLGNTGFHQSIVRGLEYDFSYPGFSEKLDKHPMALGVYQGILMLSEKGDKPSLIQSYNHLHISRYTHTRYVEFDPNCPIQRRLLLAFRAQHRNDETDAHDYKMCMMGASIDARPREPIILLMTGHGSNAKSMLLEYHHATLGEAYSTTLPIDLLLQGGRAASPEGATPMIMKLEKARLAYFEEGPNGAQFQMDMVKRLTGSAAVAGRQLYGTAEKSIKPKCHFIVLSNHDIIIVTHEEAVWRRMRKMHISIQFMPSSKFDPRNENHRPIDTGLKNQKDDPEYQSAYLAIMTFWHRVLMWRYGGAVENVPHPTIDRDTLKYRHEQDALSRYLSLCIVISPSQGDPTSIEVVASAYAGWYNSNIRETRHYNTMIIQNLKESSIRELLREGPNGTELRPGYRALASGERMHEDEKVYTPPNQTRSYETKYEPIVETPDQYLVRIEKIWADMQRHFADASNQDPLVESYGGSNPYAYKPVADISVDERAERFENRPEVSAAVVDLMDDYNV